MVHQLVPEHKVTQAIRVEPRAKPKLAMQSRLPRYLVND